MNLCGVLFQFQNYDMQGDILTPNFSIWTNASGNQITPTTNINFNNSFRRPDSVLFDDEFVPFDASTASNYGPISRLSKTVLR